MIALFLLGASTPPETISYSYRSGGICLRCPTYTITLAPDGAGEFRGERDVAALGAHQFRATADQARAFEKRLRKFRPNGDVVMQDSRFCCTVATDQDWVDVVWQAPGAPRRHLLFYGGCDLEKNIEMERALASAPSLLPIAAMIGTPVR